MCLSHLATMLTVLAQIDQTARWETFCTESAAIFDTITNDQIRMMDEEQAPPFNEAHYYKARGAGSLGTCNVSIMIQVLLNRGRFVQAGFSAWPKPVLGLGCEGTIKRIVEDISGTFEHTFPDRTDAIEQGNGVLTIEGTNSEMFAYVRIMRPPSSRRPGVIYRIGSRNIWEPLLPS